MSIDFDYNILEVGDIIETTNGERSKVIKITKDEIEVEGKLKGNAKYIIKCKTNTNQ